MFLLEANRQAIHCLSVYSNIHYTGLSANGIDIEYRI